MAVTLEYQGRSEEHNVNGIETSITYTGTKLDCDTWAASQTIGATYAGLGKLVSTTVQQQGGSIYTVTAKYQNANGASGSTGQEVVPPDYTYGEFSATHDAFLTAGTSEDSERERVLQTQMEQLSACEKGCRRVRSACACLVVERHAG